MNETNSINTQYSIVPKSRTIRVATPSIQRPRAHWHARMLVRVGPRAAPSPTHPKTDQAGELRTERRGPHRNALYIGGTSYCIVRCGRQKVKKWRI